ncbi:MAG: hypothetical protein P4L81_06770 [Candidatus Pacebacteria bacterium]|nr:hypothetical protein [Candidatus Paceibacterota bacterium]
MTQKEAKSLVYSYLHDVRHNIRTFPWALWRPHVVHGYFPNKKSGRYQKIFFKLLLKDGFRRTRWQLVLPGQTAGLIKRVSKRSDGTDQFHIRFYANGSIDCEVEHHNFDLRHWSGARYASVDELHEILRSHEEHLGETLAGEIKKLFVMKPDYLEAIKKLKDLV